MSTVSDLLYMRLCSNMDFDPITHDEVLAIIAVVEAAERWIHHDCEREGCDDWNTDLCYHPHDEDRAALAALEAKLEKR